MRLPTRYIVGLLILASTACPFAHGADFAYWPGDNHLCFEDGVYYVEGMGIPQDPITYEDYNNPCVAAGPPTIDTTSDNNPHGTGSTADPVPVVPVYPPFRAYEIVTIGQGGHLILAFENPVLDHPLNPCGIDLIIFGNAAQNLHWLSYWANGDPADTIVSGTLIREPGLVSVSQDGVTWHTFTDGPFADDFAPTLGRIFDPSAPDPSLPGNLWWSLPTDPTYPLDPSLTAAHFDGWTLEEVVKKYGYSAGGTGFDIGTLGLDWIQYVKIENPPGSGITPEIDAVAAVRPRLVPDLDCDSDVDDDDLAIFLSCMTGAGVPVTDTQCLRADFDQDGDVDMSDFGLWQVCRSGPDVLYDRDCMNGP